MKTQKNVKCVCIIKCALFDKNKVRFAHAEQLWFLSHLLSRLRCWRSRLWVLGPRLINPKTKKHNSIITDWLKKSLGYSCNKSDVQPWKWWSTDQNITDKWLPFNNSTIDTRRRLVKKATLILTKITTKKTKNQICSRTRLWKMSLKMSQDQDSSPENHYWFGFFNECS